jgi:hypothetical protein
MAQVEEYQSILTSAFGRRFAVLLIGRFAESLPTGAEIMDDFVAPTKLGILLWSPNRA